MSNLNFVESRISSVGSVMSSWSLNAWRVLERTAQSCVGLLVRIGDRIWVWGERAMENSRANTLAADELFRLRDSRDAISRDNIRHNFHQSNDAITSFARRKAGSIG